MDASWEGWEGSATHRFLVFVLSPFDSAEASRMPVLGGKRFTLGL